MNYISFVKMPIQRVSKIQYQLAIRKAPKSGHTTVRIQTFFSFQNPEVVLKPYASRCCKTLKKLISVWILYTSLSRFQTRSEFWTRHQLDADQLSETWTSPDFRHSQMANPICVSSRRKKTSLGHFLALTQTVLYEKSSSIVLKSGQQFHQYVLFNFFMLNTKVQYFTVCTVIEISQASLAFEVLILNESYM